MQLLHMSEKNGARVHIWMCQGHVGFKADKPSGGIEWMR